MITEGANIGDYAKTQRQRSDIFTAEYVKRSFRKTKIRGRKPMSIQLELQFNKPAIKPRLPPFVWEFHGQYFKGSSLWDIDLIEYKIFLDGKIRMAGWVNDHGKNNYAHPWNLHWQYRVMRGGERELITA